MKTFLGYLLNVNKRKYRAYLSDKSNTTLFKIHPQRRFIGYRIQRLHPICDVRPPPRLVNQSQKPITIHYGHKFSTKKMKRTFTKVDEKKEIIQNSENLHSFNQRIVIVKGRYLKPVSNHRKNNYYSNFHTLTL